MYCEGAKCASPCLDMIRNSTPPLDSVSVPVPSAAADVVKLICSAAADVFGGFFGSFISSSHPKSRPSVTHPNGLKSISITRPIWCDTVQCGVT